MANSLFTGVTGLRVNQGMLDVVGNNLANSNTTAFKAQTVKFSDLIYQTITQATSASAGSVGGTDPVQIGLGARVAAISPSLQQGSLESTGRDLDLALQGNGFFVARNGVETVYTRSGSFGVDSSNFLVDPSTGFRVQRFGTAGEGSAVSPAFQTSGNNDISIPTGTGIPGNATSNIVLQGNLSANAVGPLAQTLTTGQAFTSGGAPATTATLLNSLTDSVAPYPAGPHDHLQLQGVDAFNSPVSFNMPVNATTTMGDLINAINANFAGATASIDAAGILSVRSNATGVNKLTVSVNEIAGNTGGMNWGNHTFAVTTVGKDGDTVKTGIQIFDNQGSGHNLNLVFQKQANNTWSMTAQINPGEGVIIDDLVSSIQFNQDGSFQQATGTGVGDANISVQFNGFSSVTRIGFNFGTNSGFDGLTQVGGTSSAVATGQDGFAAGFLTSLAVGQDGVMNGIFTNGRTLPIAQIAIAAFANPSALSRAGGNYYELTSESGPALLGAGLSGGRGSVEQKALESSNVDVALEFTRLIIAQRGFQVNARMITASDQILQELANILR